MSEHSAIEWTDATWNPTVGCTKVSPECANCYAILFAERLAAAGHKVYQGLTKRLGDHRRFHRDGADRPTPARGPANWTGIARPNPAALTLPLSWKKPRRVFVDSMSDLFHEGISFSFVASVFGVMAMSPQHTHIVLTKRPEQALAFFGWLGNNPIQRFVRLFDSLRWMPLDTDQRKLIDSPRWELLDVWPLPNVQLGVSVGDQETADVRIPLLLRCHAAVRIVSYEPALGPVDFESWLYGECGHPCDEYLEAGTCLCTEKRPPNPHLDGVIMGGESDGSRQQPPRPMHPDWARSTRDACARAGVPFFFKQWGAWVPLEQTIGAQRANCGDFSIPWHEFADRKLAFRVGKKAAGRLLDGREHNDLPGPARSTSAAAAVVQRV